MEASFNTKEKLTSIYALESGKEKQQNNEAAQTSGIFSTANSNEIVGRVQIKGKKVWKITYFRSHTDMEKIPVVRLMSLNFGRDSQALITFKLVIYLLQHSKKENETSVYSLLEPEHVTKSTRLFQLCK